MQFALELYLHRQPESQSELVVRARSLATAARGGRMPPTFLRAVYLPEDEICFLVFEAPSADSVAQAAHDAAIPFERVLEAELLPDISLSSQPSSSET